MSSVVPAPQTRPQSILDDPDFGESPFTLMSSAEVVFRNVLTRCLEQEKLAEIRTPIGFHLLIEVTLGMKQGATFINPQPRQAAGSSLEIGTLVHAELEAYANGVAVPTPHPITVGIVEKLEEKGWRLLAAEVPVYDTETNMMTWIDFVAIDRNNCLYVCELKTGHKVGWGASLNTQFSQLLATLPDCVRTLKNDTPKNRAHIQAAWGQWGLSALHGLHNTRAVVIHAKDESNIDFEPLNRALTNQRQIEFVGAIRATRRRQLLTINGTRILPPSIRSAEPVRAVTTAATDNMLLDAATGVPTTTKDK